MQKDSDQHIERRHLQLFDARRFEKQQTEARRRERRKRRLLRTLRAQQIVQAVRAVQFSTSE